MLYLLNGKRLGLEAQSIPFINRREIPPLIYGGEHEVELFDDYIQRPADWLLTASAEDLELHGITTAEEPAPQPRPDDRYFYVDDDGTGTEKPIEQLRPVFWEHMKLARAARINGGFDFGAYKIDSDAESRANIVGAALSAQVALLDGSAWTKQWTTASNVTVEVTAKMMIDIARALDRHVQAAYDHGVELRNKIETAKTLSDLLAMS